MKTKLRHNLDNLKSQGILNSYDVTNDGCLKLQLPEKIGVIIPEGKEDSALEAFKRNFSKDDVK